MRNHCSNLPQFTTAGFKNVRLRLVRRTRLVTRENALGGENKNENNFMQSKRCDSFEITSTRLRGCNFYEAT